MAHTLPRSKPTDFAHVGGRSLSQHAFGERWGNAAGEVANLSHGPIRTDRQTNTFPLTFTPTGDLELLSPDLHVFSLWEETRAATENPFRHAENIQALRLTAKETK